MHAQTLIYIYIYMIVSMCTLGGVYTYILPVV